MDADAVQVGALGGDDYGDASVVTARAFYDDVFFEWLEPRARWRARSLGQFWWSNIVAAGRSGARMQAARRTDGHIVGISVAVPPGGYPFPVRVQLAQAVGVLHSMVRNPTRLGAGARYEAAMVGAHPKEECWYLFILAVDPSAQRWGLGARLQQEMLAEADRSGLPCYLETQKEDNLAYYRRFGYDVSEILTPVSDGPPLWTMRRPPRVA